VGFLVFARPASFSVAYTKDCPCTMGVGVLEQMERLDAVEANLKKLGDRVGGDNSGNPDRDKDMAESATAPRTRNGKQSAPFSTPERISRSSFLTRTRIVTMMA
jgi:hypothetical protein